MAKSTLQVPQFVIHELPWSDLSIRFHPYLLQNLVHMASYCQLTYLGLYEQHCTSHFPHIAYAILGEYTHSTWNAFLSLYLPEKI